MTDGQIDGRTDLRTDGRNGLTDGMYVKNLN